MALERNQIKPPVLPKEAVQVDALGGEVIVRGLLLSERLALSSQQARLFQPQAEETQEDADARAGVAMVPVTLARCVLASDNKPVWSEAEWEAFGAVHTADAVLLFNTAVRLSGQSLEASTKN